MYAEDYDQIILATIMNLTPMMTRRVPNRTGSFCHVPHTSLVEHWRSPLAVVRSRSADSNMCRTWPTFGGYRRMAFKFSAAQRCRSEWPQL